MNSPWDSRWPHMAELGREWSHPALPLPHVSGRCQWDARLESTEEHYNTQRENYKYFWNASQISYLSKLCQIPAEQRSSVLLYILAPLLIRTSSPARVVDSRPLTPVLESLYTKRQADKPNHIPAISLSLSEKKNGNNQNVPTVEDSIDELPYNGCHT